MRCTTRRSRSRHGLLVDEDQEVVDIKALDAAYDDGLDFVPEAARQLATRLALAAHAADLAVQATGDEPATPGSDG